MKRTFFFCLAILFSFSVFSQSTGPFGIWEDQANSVYKFVRMDAATGVKTNISTVPGVTAFVAAGKSAYNPHKNYYYFAGQNGATTRFYTISVATGSVVASPAMTDNVVGIEYNCKDSLLYGILVAGNLYSFCTIDPVTAQASVIANVNMTGYVAGTFTLDPANGFYNFRALTVAGYRFKSINIQTGAVVQDNPFLDNVIGHRYNPLDSGVYGLWDNNNVYKLEKVNYVNGTHTTVGTLAGVDPGYVSESNSMNEAGMYTFRGFTGPSYAIISVDVSNAAVAHMNITTDNATGFEEPNCLITPSAVNDKTGDDTFSIFPNPSGGMVNVQCLPAGPAGLMSNGTNTTTINHQPLAISIYSMFGEKICQMENGKWKMENGTSTLAIDLSSQPNGIYFLKARTNEGEVNKKIIIAK